MKKEDNAPRRSFPVEINSVLVRKDSDLRELAALPQRREIFRFQNVNAIQHLSVAAHWAMGSYRSFVVACD